jgi:hypothetical protein
MLLLHWSFFINMMELFIPKRVNEWANLIYRYSEVKRLVYSHTKLSPVQKWKLTDDGVSLTL